MKKNKRAKTSSIVVGTGLALSLASIAVAEGHNPFAEKPVVPSAGIQVASADGGCGDGKCGSGKCGAGKCGAKTDKTSTSVRKAKDGQCGAHKADDGKCGTDDKSDEGRCGEGKCGA